MSAYLTDDSGEITAQITRLLCDETTDNAPLILELIAGGGANRRLKGYLFGITVAHKQAEVQNRAARLLRQYTSADTFQQAERLRNAMSYHYNEADYLGKYKNTEFDLFDFLLAYKMCNWHGLSGSNSRADRYRLSHETLNLASYPENRLSEAVATLGFVRHIILPHQKDFDLDDACQHLMYLPLESIYIENVRLAHFPNYLFNLPKLKILSIRRGTSRPRSPMEVRDTAPHGSATLEKLFIEGYAMRQTQYLGPFPNLKIGSFMRCGLDNVQFLEQSLQLEELNLKFNLLTSLPAFVGLLVELRTLEISSNPFEKIELDMHRLNKLEELELKLKIERTRPLY